MQRRRGFTLIELLVVVAVISVLISILIPSLSRARKQARSVSCMANERVLVDAYRIYFQNMGQVLNSTGHGNTGAWDYQLLGAPGTPFMLPAEYYTNNGRGAEADKPRFCAETNSDRRGTTTTPGSATTCWDCKHGPGGGSTGSYGMNNWLYVPQGSEASSYWRIRSATGEFGIPVFVDCAWHDFKAHETDAPGANLTDPEAGNADRKLNDVAMDRHSRGVNVAFWDAHVENVKLPNVWTVKWSATWSRTTPYSLSFR